MEKERVEQQRVCAPIRDASGGGGDDDDGDDDGCCLARSLAAPDLAARARCFRIPPFSKPTKPSENISHAKQKRKKTLGKNPKTKTASRRPSRPTPCR